jgi:hypothetical protein
MSYADEWIPGGVLLGTVLLLLIVPSFALIALVVVALAAVVALVALAGATLAMPYLLVSSLRRRLAKRRESTEGPIPIAVTPTGRATKQSGVAAFAEPTTARDQVVGR